jgi:transcriptional regulator with XRE-family HTH domain
MGFIGEIGEYVGMDNRWLGARRKALGITQGELADRLTEIGEATIRGTVTAWESNKREIRLLNTLEGVRILAQALDWKVSNVVFAVYGDDLNLEVNDKSLPSDVAQILERILGYNAAQRAAVWAMLDIVDAIPDVDASKLRPGRTLLSDSESDVE